MNILDASRSYLERGWSILPVGPDKRPLCSWQCYQKDRADGGEAVGWYTRWPDAGVGIVTGAISGLLVVDVDAGDAEKFAAAKAKLETLIPDNLVTPMARTGRGGLHYYFKRPADGRGNRARIDGFAIDVRCDGGYVVAPPSVGYAWIVDPDHTEIAEVPEALLRFVTVRTAKEAGNVDPRPAAPVLDMVVERARRYVATMPGAISGQGGHNATLRAASALTWGWALESDADVIPIMHEYNRRCDPPWTDRELEHKVKSARGLTNHQHPYGYLRDKQMPGNPKRHRADQPIPEGEEYDANEGRAPNDPNPEELEGRVPGARREPPTIHIGTDQHRVIVEAISALVNQQHYYQRGGNLVRVVQGAAPPGVARPSAYIDIVPNGSLEIALSAAAQWLKVKKTKEGDEWIPATPPQWAVVGVTQARYWHGVPPLVGIVGAPTIRADGSLLREPGYDRDTGLFYRPVGQLATVPEYPTEEQAVEARNLLLDAVSDFPFESEVHKAGWLAMLLTMFCRPTINDSVPLFYIDANTRGSGKSLLAQVAAVIAGNQKCPVTSLPGDEEERGKTINTIILEGQQVVIFDNIEGSIGGQTLNTVLTADSWCGRILGMSRSTGNMPIRQVWVATGNNCDFARDTVRRTIHIRLMSQHEHPEERTDCKHVPLIPWIIQERPKLAAAALTVLRAYAVAGMPDMKLAPMGAYSEWTRIVRGAVTWVGMPDPVSTQRELETQADRDAGELRAIIEGIASIQDRSTWYTSAELIDRADNIGGESLKAALLEYVPSRTGDMPSSRQIGQHLRRLRGRVAGGRCITMRPGREGISVWRVESQKSNPAH